MSTSSTATRSSASRTKRHRERRRQGTRCVVVDVNQGELDALVVRGYLTEGERGSGAALKKAIEAVLSDIELDLQSETSERTRARV
jgi:hypothetical protein